MEKYKFSIIMAVYNVSEYIDEAIESLLSQTIPFEEIQLILVDDGSTDNSRACCEQWQKRYPNNISLLCKENGGQASARNLGKQYAVGRYVNFMDPDDKISPETLQIVYDFFIENEEKTDIVTIPMFFFGSASGPHWQNEKFNKGNRIINLREDYKHQLTSSSSSFFTNWSIKTLSFDTALFPSEDFKIILSVLADKQTLGVVEGCTYFYRRRNQLNSTTDNSISEKRWYTEFFDHFAFWAIALFRDKYGQYPQWVQYSLLCDLYWRIASDHYTQMLNVLTKEEIQLYLCNLKKYVREFDDQMIMSMSFYSADQRLWMLKQKYPNENSNPIWQYDRVMMQYHGFDLAPVNDLYTEITSVNVIHDEIIFKGYCMVFPDENIESIGIALIHGDEWHYCKTWPAPPKNKNLFGEPILKAVAFEGKLSIPQQQTFEIKIGAEYSDDLRCVKKSIVPGPNLPVSMIPHATVLLNGYKYYFHQGMICFVTCRTIRDKFKREIVWDFMILRNQAFNILLYRWFGIIARKIKKKQIWLISDRYNKADDNGEVFFEYLMKEKKKEVSPYFILSEKAADYPRLKKTGRAIKAGGKIHKILSIAADTILSSCGREENRLHDPFGPCVSWNKDLLFSKPFIFLTHGVNQNNLSEYDCIWNQGFAGFSTSAKTEQASIISGDYGYSEQEVWLTGLARYDRLASSPEKIITVMPTWRKYLGIRRDDETGNWIVQKDFKNSVFCSFYHQLLTDEKLLNAAHHLGYTIKFMPHPNILPYIDLFEPDPSIIVSDNKTTYKNVFTESAMIVTDYSSVAFDFAYQKRPLIYAQFDPDLMFSESSMYKRGYFDYKRDGFGPVTKNVGETVEIMITYMENGCRMEETYAQRVDQFFAFHDRENCKRIYEKTAQLLQRMDN